MIDYALTSLQPVAQTPRWPKKKDLREGQTPIKPICNIKRKGAGNEQ
jgi:hypothetical protein